MHYKPRSDLIYTRFIRTDTPETPYIVTLQECTQVQDATLLNGRVLLSCTLINHMLDLVSWKRYTHTVQLYRPTTSPIVPRNTAKAPVPAPSAATPGELATPFVSTLIRACPCTTCACGAGDDHSHPRQARSLPASRVGPAGRSRADRAATGT